jgi:hypothetical protein
MHAPRSGSGNDQCLLVMVWQTSVQETACARMTRILSLSHVFHLYQHALWDSGHLIKNASFSKQPFLRAKLLIHILCK